MTFESRAQAESHACALLGTRHKSGTSWNLNLCPHKLLFSICFLTKGHKGTSKEGGRAEMRKTAKKGQKEGKREEYKKHQRNRKHLCLVPFQNSGALA